MHTESSAVALVPSAAAHSVPSFATKQLGLGQDKLDACGQGNELQVGITALYNVSIIGGQLQGGPTCQRRTTRLYCTRYQFSSKATSGRLTSVSPGPNNRNS